MKGFSYDLFVLFCIIFLFQDIDMRRGKPLYLNEERYAALTYMVIWESFFFSFFVVHDTRGFFFLLIFIIIYFLSLIGCFSWLWSEFEGSWPNYHWYLLHGLVWFDDQGGGWPFASFTFLFASNHEYACLYWLNTIWFLGGDAFESDNP